MSLNDSPRPSDDDLVLASEYEAIPRRWVTTPTLTRAQVEQILIHPIAESSTFLHEGSPTPTDDVDENNPPELP